MKKNMLLFLFFLLIVTPISAQKTIEKYVKENTVAVKSISPDSTDYTDLEAFGNAVADARVVMLGEQDHGDAATFVAKTRLIKYLHEKKGFNVLAFESDFFSLNYRWEEVKANQKNMDSLIKKSIYALWTMCSACSNLFYSYIPGTFKEGTPLQLSGFDPQMDFMYGLHIMDSIMRLSENQKIILSKWYKNKKDTTLNNQYQQTLLQIKQDWSSKVSTDDFWLLYIDNLIAWNRSETVNGYYERLNARDEQMGRNLIWLLRHKYQDQKVIVWAHNYHISKDAGNYEDATLNPACTMGSYFVSHAPDIKTYILGFTSYEGTAGRLYKGLEMGRIYKVSKPKANSFENWIDHNDAFAFVDFQQFNISHPSYRESFYLSGAVMGSLYHRSYKASWNNIFDGVFFIRTMYPCEWM